MDKIASPEDLKTELRTLLAYCEGPDRPFRNVIVATLYQLAERVVEARSYNEYVEEKRKKGEEPKSKMDWAMSKPEHREKWALKSNL